MKCIICGKEIVKSAYSNEILCCSKCFNINFWNEKIRIKDKPRVVRIKGEHYYISDENSKSIRGFGGNKFKIRFFDGREVITTNLWYNGKIPESHKKLLSDNVEFMS